MVAEAYWIPNLSSLKRLGSLSTSWAFTGPPEIAVAMVEPARKQVLGARMVWPSLEFETAASVV